MNLDLTGGFYDWLLETSTRAAGNCLVLSEKPPCPSSCLFCQRIKPAKNVPQNPSVKRKLIKFLCHWFIYCTCARTVSMCHSVSEDEWFAPSVCGNPGIEIRLPGMTANAFTSGSENLFLWNKCENIFSLVPEISLRHFRAYHCGRTKDAFQFTL